MKSGIILEIKGDKAIILQNGGQICSIPARQNWQIGDIVTVKEKNNWKMAACALVACFFVTVLCNVVFYMEITTISLDINPSIEIGLNSFDRVRSVRAMNEEGREILSGLSLKNRTYEDAIAYLLTEGLADYTNNSRYLTLSVQTDLPWKEKEVTANVEVTAKEAVLPHHQNMMVECYQVDKETLETAHGHNVTAGKYLALLELAETEPSININDFTNDSIAEIKEHPKHCSEIIEEPQQMPSCHKKSHH